MVEYSYIRSNSGSNLRLTPIYIAIRVSTDIILSRDIIKVKEPLHLTNSLRYRTQHK